MKNKSLQDFKKGVICAAVFATTYPILVFTIWFVDFYMPLLSDEMVTSTEKANYMMAGMFSVFLLFAVFTPTFLGVHLWRKRND